MSFLATARAILPKAAVSDSDGQVTLGYDARFLRRKRLETDDGVSFMVDLAETTSLSPGDAFALDDGRRFLIRAAEEPVVLIKGDLPRLAWHIGNRHTPCQITPTHLIIRRDHVLEAMLQQLGAGLAFALMPFHPEGGAYGHGRTLGHDHGH